jgi:hypothetical protein
MRLCVRMLGIASRGTATEPPPKLRARVWLPDSSHVPTFIGGPKSELSPKLLEVFHVAQLVHDTIGFCRGCDIIEQSDELGPRVVFDPRLSSTQFETLRPNYACILFIWMRRYGSTRPKGLM